MVGKPGCGGEGDPAVVGRPRRPRRGGEARCGGEALLWWGDKGPKGQMGQKRPVSF